MSSLIVLLKQCEIFYKFTATQLELVANLCREITFAKGEIIFEENSSSKELYVIARGEVEILINTNSNNTTSKSGKGKTVIARMYPGQSFGEIALVDEGLRSATARAAQKDTLLLAIPRDKLVLLCETYPELGYRLMQNLAADLAMKVRNTDLRIREQILHNP